MTSLMHLFFLIQVKGGNFTLASTALVLSEHLPRHGIRVIYLSMKTEKFSIIALLDAVTVEHSFQF